VVVGGVDARVGKGKNTGVPRITIPSKKRWDEAVRWYGEGILCAMRVHCERKGAIVSSVRERMLSSL